MSKEKSVKKEKIVKKEKDAKKRDEDFSSIELAHSITQVARSMRTVLSHRLGEAGLYAGQDAVILAIAEDGSATPGKIAQRLGVKAPTITRTISRLEAQGFVERRSVDDDGRLTMVSLTPAGEKSVDHINLSLSECSDRAVEGLSPKEVKSLIKILKLVDENLHAEEDEA
jgi:DNA-binding MarR family transcriptional regulator